jgi:hypothetical protein
MQRARVLRSLGLALPVALTLAALGACAKKTPAANLAPTATVTAPRTAHQALALRIDELLLAEQRRRGAVATPLVGDELFLRRVTLDLVGRLPSEAEVRAFSSSADADKRAKKVDELLASAERPRYLARVFEPLLLGPARAKDARVDRGAMRRWLEARLSVRDGYDAVVRDLLTAEGKSSLGGARRESIAAGAERTQAEREAGRERRGGLLPSLREGARRSRGNHEPPVSGGAAAVRAVPRSQDRGLEAGRLSLVRRGVRHAASEPGGAREGRAARARSRRGARAPPRSSSEPLGARRSPRPRRARSTASPSTSGRAARRSPRG